MPTGLGDERVWIIPDEEVNSSDSAVTNFGSDGTTLSIANFGSNEVTDGGLTVYQLDGSNQSIVANTTYSISSDSDFTLSGWFKPDALSASRSVLATTSNNDQQGFTLAADNTAVTAMAGYNSSPQTITYNSPLATGSWSHLCFISDITNDVARLYINGSQVSTDLDLSANSGSPQETVLRVGNDNFFGLDAFDGRVNDIRLFNRAISSAELAHLASQQNVSGGPGGGGGGGEPTDNVEILCQVQPVTLYASRTMLSCVNFW